MPKADLSVDLNGLGLKNPIMSASGTFGCGKEFSDFYDINMLGAIVTKTVTLKEKKGNPPPRVCEVNCGMINSIGLQNKGVDSFIEENKKWLDSLNTKVIISISGETFDEFSRIASKLNNVKCDGIELNVSCPNVKKGGMLFGFDPDAVYNVVKSVKKATDKFIILKLAPMTHLVKDVAIAAQDAGAHAVCAANTIPAVAVDLFAGKFKLGNISGGLSGPCIKHISQKIVYDISKVVKIPIIGCGGISTFEDVLEYVLLGASAVQIGSANFKNPLLCKEILEGIEKFLFNSGIERLKDLIGAVKAG